jgi:hypothetical protein
MAQPSASFRLTSRVRLDERASGVADLARATVAATDADGLVAALARRRRGAGAPLAA